MTQISSCIDELVENMEKTKFGPETRCLGTDLRLTVLVDDNNEIQYFAFGLQHEVFIMATEDASCAHTYGFR